jgi:DNA-binding transcriptional LysR family regulator
MDIELLRTFVAVLDSESFARAGARRHITQSTVSQQMKRLSSEVGRPLFTALGRRRMPTASAELLSSYAQRLLALHDEAARALGDDAERELVRIGAAQDFADVRLPAVLRAFRQSHPRVRLEVRVGASGELTRLVEASALDVAVVFDVSRGEPSAGFLRERACWLAGPGFAPPPAGQPWPLALFDAPCVFRDRALQTLDAARLPWRIVYSTPSLSGLLAAVRAGLAITLRIARHSQKGVQPLGSKHGLPAAGNMSMRLITADPPTVAARALCSAIRAEARTRRK